MDDALKQRLIGAAVILALAVIFIPMLLDGSGQTPMQEIPAAPQPKHLDEQVEVGEPLRIPPLASQPVTAPEPTPSPPPAEQQNPSITPAAPEPTAPTQAPAVSPSAPPSEPGTTPAVAGDLQAWVVQVGSFRESDKAIALRDKLRKKGFKAFVDKVRLQDKDQYRVRVGPELKREDADKLKQRLASKADLKQGFVTSHP